MLPSSEDKADQAWEYLEERFGVERKDLPDFYLEKRSGDYWIHTNQDKDLDYETKGIRCLRATGRGLKPTTYALQLLEKRISRNIVKLNEKELIDLLDRRQMISREREKEGYVAMEYDERIIGCGYYKDSKVSSRVPKGRSGELKKIIES